MTLAINIVAFQVGWLACVLGAANALPALGPAVVACALVLHLTRSRVPSRELLLVLAAGLVGAIWDSVLVAAGWLTYPSGNLIAGAAPYWIVAMWMLFATTLNVSLRWLRGRAVLAAVLGALSGPAAYYAGARLGGLQFLDSFAGFGALAIGWAVLLPVMSAMSVRLDGMTIRSREQAHV